MGVSVTFVLVCSNVIIALLRKVIPAKIRIPCFIVIIATFVTIVQMVLEAFVPSLFSALGVFIPLIVVNCIILGRAEAFAYKSPVLFSLIDGLGMGIGYTLAITIMGVIREILGNGTVFGIAVFGSGYMPMLVMILPPGSFILLGLLIGGLNKLQDRQSKAKEGCCE
jgi:electron transport complex protein RnfE